MHTKWVRFVLTLVILVQFYIPAHAAEQDEYTAFISGFTAFQNQDYKTAVDKMTIFLKDYPTTPMRDMALFWLARAHFRLGHREDAARYMAQFFRENPDTPLRNAVEDELASLADRYERGESVAAAPEKPEPATVSEEIRVAAAPPPAPSAKPGEKPDRRPALAAANGKGREPRKSGKPAPALKDRAVSEYRRIIEKYPGTRAAASAEERLKGLSEGKTAQGDVPVAPARSGVPGKGVKIVTLEVGQYASLDLAVLPHPGQYRVGKRVAIPFEVLNRGNDADSFLLETGYPRDFNPLFASAAKPDVPITATPRLSAGEKFKGVLTLAIPIAYVDGRKSTYPLKAVSRFDGDVSLSKDVSLVSMAPLLRMALKPDKEHVRPGETVSYRIALLNLGTTEAKNVSISVTYPSQYEPEESRSGGFRREGRSVLISDEMAVGSGERKEFNLVFRLKDEALAGQELFCRAEVNNRQLQLKDTFLSSVAVVGKVSGVSARAGVRSLTVLPGQRTVIPLTVTNTGNVRERFSLRLSVPAGMRYALFRSMGDAARQSDEPVSGVLGPLSPKEEASLKLEIFAPADLADGSETKLAVAFEPEGDDKNPAAVSVSLRFSRPVVELEMAGKGGRLKPGEISHLVLGVVNRGSATAKDLEVRSLLPDRLEVVASDPPCAGANGEDRVWRLAELGPGEKRNIVISFRVRADVAAGTNLSIENMVRYRDQQGNSY